MPHDIDRFQIDNLRSPIAIRQSAIDARQSVMPSPARQFFIDVGGTFTDVVALRDDGSPATWKLLSSGVIRGVVEAGSTPGCIIDSRRVGDPVGFWIGYTLTVGRRAARITAFDPQTGALSFHPPLEAPPVPGTGYELTAEEEAPVLAVRYLLGVPLSQAIGAVEVRLGTTRATNALLERRGARVALITTKGFADVLKIGCQDRPDLFRLDIRKRDELTETVVEIDERLAADGTVLRSPDKRDVRRQLEELRDAGIQTLAVCLLHAHVNPGHEELIADLAGQIGFDHVSFSSRIARIEKIVPRGDTTVVDAYLA
ncbi:MAG: hydantoinase/oxoprolinase N-terminal domain-containing protein, partial [Phycisphaerae bacterium]